jgi:hypothetical protein
MAVSGAACLCLIHRECERRIVAEIIPCQAPEMRLIQNDHAVEQIVAKTSDPPFGNSVLPWAAVAGADSSNTGGV